jgi:glycosyltransferase involved in cell wall biosynthesis
MGSREDVLVLLKASDVFCLPSRSEGFSNALIEAMACGLPVVATNVGGNSEAVTDGVDGYLVAPESSVQIADRILLLLHCPARAQRLGYAARQTVEQRFSFDAMIRTLTQVYEEVVQVNTAHC